MWPFNNKKQVKKRKYDGGSKGRRTAGWITGAGDANAQISGSLPTLRERSRYLRRNNPYIHNGIDAISNNVVGKGIMTQFDDEGIEEMWKEWAESTDIDYDGRNDINGLQAMIMEAVAESGEVLVRRRVTAGLKYPFQYQVLEADFLDSTILDVKANGQGNFVIQGVEFDASGKRVGYHVYETHPGSIEHQFSSLSSNFIPASEILHIYRAERPGQVRGVPWTSPVMIKVKDLDDYEDAELMKQKIAACFTAFVHDISADVDCEDESDLGEKIEPALIEQLPPGKTISFSNPPDKENYKEFTSTHLRAVAAGLGVSYVTLTGDLTDTNFSSGRLGWISEGRNFDKWRKNIMITQFQNPIVKDFKAMLAIMGVDASRSKATHIPPKREMIDPTKEVPAMIKSVRAGFSSRSETIASLGKDAAEVYKKVEQDNKIADEKGLVFDSDARLTTIGGKIQEGDDDVQENGD